MALAALGLRGLPMQRNYFQDCLSSKGFARPAPARHCAGMVSLTDNQLEIVLTAARTVPIDRRSILMERIGAMLRLRGRFTDADVRQVVELAACGLVHAGAA
jgi:hypothetical protein